MRKLIQKLRLELRCDRLFFVILLPATPVAYYLVLEVNKL